MRVLFVSSSPIRNEISIGNTFLNLFDGEDAVELASICTRKGVPDAPITRCFCITEKMILRNLLRKTPVGEYVSIDACISKGEYVYHSGIPKLVKRFRWTVFFWIQDLVWSLGNWKSKELEEFIREYNPDVIFSVLSNSVFLNKLILHVHAVSDAKLVLYAWDDNYSMRQFMLSPLRWIKHLIDRASMRKLVCNSDKLYVISDVQKRDYEKSFQRECKLLTKGADFDELPAFKETYNDPLQLVFTGNIGLNRWKSLKMIADVLENINKEETKAQLRVYTAAPLTKKMEKALNRGDSSIVMGSVPASAVADIQKNADMLVHVEALDLKNKLAVRQSFSTKIVDYLKAARPILAVGPKDVASIDHLIRNNCAIVADHKEELEHKLRVVLADKAEFQRIAGNCYECGKEYHNRKKLQAMLMRDLREVCKQ